MPRASTNAPSKMCPVLGCKQFGKEYMNVGGLNRHTNAKHLRTVQYECPYCGISMARRSTCRGHIDNYCHERPSDRSVVTLRPITRRFSAGIPLRLNAKRESLGQKTQLIAAWTVAVAAALSPVVFPLGSQSPTSSPAEPKLGPSEDILLSPVVVLPQLVAAPTPTKLGLGHLFNLNDMTPSGPSNVSLLAVAPAVTQSPSLHNQQQYCLSHESYQYNAPQAQCQYQLEYQVLQQPYQYQAPRLVFPAQQEVRYIDYAPLPVQSQYMYASAPVQQGTATPLGSQEWQPRFPIAQVGSYEWQPVTSTSSAPQDWTFGPLWN